MVGEVPLGVLRGGAVIVGVPDVPPQRAVAAVFHTRLVNHRLQIHNPRTATRIQPEIRDKFYF